jgi:hypothetical protein
MHRFVFHDLETPDRRLQQLREDIGYLVLAEVVDRNHSETVGRIEFSASALAPYLEEPSEEATFEEAGQLDMEAATTGSTTEDLARAASRWIRETARMNMGDRKDCKFKVSAWRPKGEQQLLGARFTCEDTEFEESRPEEPVKAANSPFPTPIVAPTVQLPPPDSFPDARHWRALGDGYTHLIHLLQQSYAHLATLQNTTVSNQNVQILRLQKVLEELMGEMLKLRIGIAEATGSVQQESRETRMREELGKQFISEIGTFGRVFASAKLGMSPELVELAELVSASPELLDAMKNPKVRAMLRDEKTRKELAALLMMAAAGGTNTPPTEENQSAA